jgi:negative regulator of sigma-B (phosphoserine phosphatase)
VPEIDESRTVECAVRGRARQGETTTGDLAVTRRTEAGTLVAVVDGLGHGPLAAHAARLAVQTAARHAEETLPAIATACHEALRTTRGAAISLAAVSSEEHTLTWLGIGNVAGMVAGGIPTVPCRRVPLPLLDGIVGHHLPPLIPATVEVERGDVLVVTTDGAPHDVADHVALAGSTSAIAERLLGDEPRSDDSLVLVLRYLGPRR